MKTEDLPYRELLPFHATLFINLIRMYVSSSYDTDVVQGAIHSASMSAGDENVSYTLRNPTAGLDSEFFILIDRLSTKAKEPI